MGVRRRRVHRCSRRREYSADGGERRDVYKVQSGEESTQVQRGREYQVKTEEKRVLRCRRRRRGVRSVEGESTGAEGREYTGAGRGERVHWFADGGERGTQVQTGREITRSSSEGVESQVCRREERWRAGGESPQVQDGRREYTGAEGEERVHWCRRWGREKRVHRCDGGEASTQVQTEERVHGADGGERCQEGVEAQVQTWRGRRDTTVPVGGEEESTQVLTGGEREYTVQTRWESVHRCRRRREYKVQRRRRGCKEDESPRVQTGRRRVHRLQDGGREYTGEEGWREYTGVQTGERVHRCRRR
uniref:Uncharacterized protein n=1 Tax=Knipowitschia caucasica TaxID=637954 RepID=A0AAV2JM85_KNICA